MEFHRLYTDGRRSTRAFTGRTLCNETIHSLLQAATRAPNACNLQSWHFYVLDQKNIAKLVPDVYRGEWILKAGAAFVVCTEDSVLAERFGERGKMFAIQDTAAAMIMLLLEAANIGWSGCWLGAFEPEACRRLLSIPEGRVPVAIAVIGEAHTQPPMRDRKPLGEVCTMVGDFDAPGDKTEATAPFTLRSGNYGGALFQDLNLAEARFDDIWLADGKFNNINMSGTVFTDINLSGASYAGVDMAGTRFGAVDAESTCVEMNKAKFTQVDFTEAVLKNCRLCDIRLENCDLTGMTIDGIPAEEYFKK
ncbi:MAG: nitroreductase family protein [Clostridia bacterium]|nr:nitroreductase family protein [Clostridia bacterium]